MLTMASPRDKGNNSEKQMGEDRVGTVMLFSVPIVCLHIDNKERLCLAQISNTILRDFSYNEIHNRRVALGITCMQCSPSQLEILRRTGAMPVSSRRCGLITKREAERLVKSFIEDIPPPRLPEDFAFKVSHACGWGSKGLFMPSRYNSSRAKCIKCLTCDAYFSPNKFIFHYHKLAGGEYKHPDAANFNSWRRHLVLADDNPSETLMHAWEDVKAMFNGGCRKRFSSSSRSLSSSFMPRSEVADVGPTDSPFQRLGSNPYFGAFVPPTSRTHSAFPNPMFGRITSYGDYLRSLSLPYNNPWTGKLDFPQSPHNVPAHGGKPEQYGLPGHGSCLPLNIPYPAPRNWPDGHLLPAPSGMAPVSSSMTSMSALPSQPCFPEKVELANKKRVEPSNKIEVEPESSTESTDLGSEEPSPAKKQRLTTTEPDSSIDVEKNDLDPGARFADNVTDESASDDKDVIDVETTDAKEEEAKSKEPTEEDVTNMAAAEVDLDGGLDTEHLQLMPIDSLRNAVSKAMTQRRVAEKDHKKIQNMLRLRALKELELREEFARQFCSIKENLWSEIEQERTAKGALEEKLKETRQLLQRLSRHMPESVLLPSCK
ncbi:SKI family transcriptional corepressor 1 homolog-B-like [Haliotis rubra]|uniref:SKI family transcriptional corepressor 1 homolog-B-like n=1 Tax=Haliotis rubra TaxID=36100 RepID=UPI001EE61F13|nr:SKI family transcriptional corepressor 1 homolog-B-like [Haliotis rubra]